MENELSWSQRKEWAKDLYVKLEKNISQIAALTGSNEATVRNWIDHGNWSDIRQTLIASKNARVKRYYALLEDLDQRPDDPAVMLRVKHIDVIGKVTGSIQHLESDDSICTIIEAAEQFTSWLLHKDIAFAKMVIVQFDAFIKQKLAA
jgi:hypothetical protein